MPPQYVTDYLAFIGATEAAEALVSVSSDGEYLYIFERFSQDTQILKNPSSDFMLGQHVTEN